MAYDVVVVGAGTAGCVLAARLSEQTERTVCLVEAGPDYGPRAAGRWPTDLLDPRALTFSHEWGRAGEDGRSLGGRLVGGSSAMNACMVVSGAPADYDEWGPEWGYESFRPYLERARDNLRTATANTSVPAPPHEAFLRAAVEAGARSLAAPDDPREPVGAGRSPANVADGVRWNSAFAHLDEARERANLTVLPDTLVARVDLAGPRCRGVVTARGQRIESTLVVLAAGAYFSPAVLLRSGIGPARDVRPLGITPVADLPVGARLLDHHGTSIGWEPTEQLDATCRAHADEHGPLSEPHALVKAASSRCGRGLWDLHLLSWVTPPTGEEPHHSFAVAVFHMKPLSHGSLRLRSPDPRELPLVERGFLTSPGDLDVIVDGIAQARVMAGAASLAPLLGRETRPGPLDAAEHARSTMRNYFHPAGTCPLGEVVDAKGRVLGVEGIVVADASVMPTIPRANTNLTVAAIAERIAESL